MEKRISFEDLPPSLRAPALVGSYLQRWAIAEGQINDALSAALELDLVPSVVLTRNIQLRDKLNILKTMVHVAIPKPDQKGYQDAVEKLRTLSEDRNMIAHNLFSEDDEGDGVRFFVTKAKGKLTFPDVRWSIAKFNAKYADLIVLASKLGDLREVLRRYTVAKALSKNRNILFGSGFGLLALPFSPNPLLSAAYPTGDEGTDQTPDASP